MKNKKNFRYSVNANTLIIGAIVIVLLLNSILIALNDKISLQLDFTYDEIFKLTDETKEIVSKIDEDVEILMITDGSDTEMYSLVRNILDKYTQENSKISFSEINYVKNPIEIKPYLDEMPTMQLGSLILKSAGKHEIANSKDFFTNNSQSNVERVVTGKLANFMDEYTISEIMLTSGHGEAAMTSANAIFEMEGYKTVSFDSLTENFPKDANSLVIICAPQKDFGAEEIDKLDKYLDNGGNVQIYFDPYHTGEDLTKLESYLAEEWGIVRSKNVVFDTQGIEGSQYLLAELGDHEIVKPLKEGQKRVAYIPANPIEISDTLPVYVEAGALLTTSNSAYSATMEEITANAYQKPSDSEKGKINLVVAATRKNYDLDGKETTGKLLVSGTAETFNSIVSDTRFANEDLLLNTIGWMKGNSANISIRAKILPSGQLMLERNQFWSWFVVLVVIIPVLLLAAGLTVFVKRRYK
ncbi:MAG: Gldg family protein [Clostridia bacterium]|nr:Gldg family protein [Clostridia bacterium]